MFAERPARPAGEETNPYAPPTSAAGEEPIELEPIDGGEIAMAEAIRRAHLGHEAAVKSIGSLHFLGAFFGFLGVAFIVIGSVLGAAQLGVEQVAFLFGGLLVYVALIGFHLALGIGLTRLQTWARWTDAVLISLSLLTMLVALVTLVFLGMYPAAVIYLIGSAIPGYMLYLLVSRKSSTVFAPEYKAIIARTPHVRYRTSLLVKIALAFLVMVILLAIVAAIVGGAR